MGKRIKVKMAPETTYTGSEVTDMSPRIVRRASVTAKAVRKSFRLGKAISRNKFPLFDKETGMMIAILAKSDGLWTYMIRDPRLGADGKIHRVGNREETILACVNKVRGYQVTV